MNEVKFENKILIENKEILTLEQKEMLAGLWVDLVVDCENVPDNMEALSQEKMKDWMFQTIMHDTKRLMAEWKIESDEEKIKEIVFEENVQRKSQLEKEYILEMHKRVNDKVREFSDKLTENRRWNSWPKAMRENNSFNCVGATMLGVEILENAGIQSYYGNPVGHVINIARLSNGDWWYVDFLHDDSQCKQIEPEEIILEGVKVLKIKENDIDYSLIPIEDNSEIIRSVINNFIAMNNEINDEEIDDNDPRKMAARDYVDKYGKNIPDVAKLRLISESIFSKQVQLWKTPELLKERKRIRELFQSNKGSMDFFRSLVKEEEKRLIKELSDNVELLESLFLDNDESFYDSVSENTKKFVYLVRKELQSKSTNKGEYEKAMSSILEKIQGLKNI